MKKIIFFIFLIILFPLYNQSLATETVYGSGIISKKEQKIKDIHSLKVQGFLKVIITQSDEESLTVQADDNIIPLIKIKTLENNLSIKTKGRFNTKNPIICFLKVKEIEAIEQSGSTEIDFISKKSKKFTINASGNSTIIGDIDAQLIELKAKGRASIILKGKVETQIITGSGSIDYNAQNLISENAIIRLNGCSTAIVQVNKKITSSLRGLGKIYYKDNSQVKIFSKKTNQIQKL